MKTVASEGLLVLLMALAPAAEPREDQTAAIAAIAKAGGQVKLDESASDKPVVEVTLTGRRVTDASLAELAASLRSLPHLRKLTLASPQVTDSGLEHLAGLSGLQELRLNSNITGKGLAHLAGLKNLQAVDFFCAFELTDDGLANVKHLGSLRRLHLVATPQISDAAMKNLSGLTSLEELRLAYTGVTDAGLTHLKGLTGLRTLHLKPLKTMEFSEERIRELEQALPHCKIVR